MAIQFAPVDNHLHNTSTFNIQNGQPFSINVWVRGVWSGGARRSFVGTYGPAAGPTTALQIGTSTGSSEISCWTWGGGNMVQAANPFAADNIWYNICYTYDGTNNLLYINGVLAASTTIAQRAGSIQEVYLNGYPGGGTAEVSNHTVDTYLLYQRTLTPAEILTVYNANGSRHGIVNAMIANYEFDENVEGSSVSSVIDLTGNGYTLTNIGAAAACKYTYIGSLADTNIRAVQT